MPTFRVMSFNLRASVVKRDGENIWPARAALNVETILKYAPDLIGFQEFDYGNGQTYQSGLQGYEHLLGPHYNPPHCRCYNACYWKPSFGNVLAEGGFWLSRTPERYSGDWGTNCIRCAHWLKFELASGAQFVFITTHLDHVSEEARVEGCKLILRRLREICPPAMPVIFTGDFNCDPGSPAYCAALEEGFSDTFLSAGNSDGDDAFSFHAFTGQRVPKFGRIDWILTRGGQARFKVHSHKIIRDAQPPVYPSDHFPVLAEIELAQ